MSFGTRHGSGQPSQEEFERILIASARADELPEARAHEAWSLLAGKLAGATGGMAGVPGAAAARRVLGPEGTAAVRSGYGAAAKWLLVGAVGGGVLTAGFMWHDRGASRPASGVIASAGASNEEVMLAERPDRARIAAAELDDGIELVRPEARRSARPATRAAPRTPGPSVTSAPSTLAAEVAALDAARKTAAAGDPVATLHLIDRYQYDFPEGELAAEAEVVAIEALAAKGDRDEVARRVARFLARHPNDPHAAEVKRLGSP